MFEIEKNVELPDAKSGRVLKYPWDKMENGDSFWIKADDKGAKYMQGSMTTMGHSFFKKRGVKAKIATRAEEKDGKEGVRVWVFFE